MNSLKIEIKKCRRSGILLIIPIVGILGALYAFVNFAVRKESLLNLPMPPMVILLTQVYGMIMVLNMFGIISACVMAYNIEFNGNAVKKMYMLPINPSSIFSSKYFIQILLLALAVIIQNLALGVIGNMYLPEGTFELITLLKYSLYIFITSIPVLSFMLLIGSRCENMWISLGIGIIGFFSGLAMTLSDNLLSLLNPFVIMMKPATGMGIDIDIKLVILALAESVIFYMAASKLNKLRNYE